MKDEFRAKPASAAFRIHPSSFILYAATQAGILTKLFSSSQFFSVNSFEQSTST